MCSHQPTGCSGRPGPRSTHLCPGTGPETVSKIDKMMNAMSISLHRNSSSRSKVGLVQLDGRSRSFALNVCAAVVFCVGADMAVVAGARRASEYGTVDDSRPLSKTLLLTQPVLQSANFVTDRIISTSGGAGPPTVPQQLRLPVVAASSASSRTNATSQWPAPPSRHLQHSPLRRNRMGARTCRP